MLKKNQIMVGGGIAGLLALVFLSVFLISNEVAPREGMCGNNLCEPAEMLLCPDDCNCVFFTSIDESNESVTESVCSSAIWSLKYDASRRKAGISDLYVAQTDKYDFGQPSVQEAIHQMKLAGITNSYQAIEWAAKYVNEHTVYDFSQTACVYGGSNELCSFSAPSCQSEESCKFGYPENRFRCISSTGVVCEEDTSSSVLERGCGWCSTQSYAVIGILRGAGIATKQIRGCAYWDVTCLAADGTPVIRKDKPEILPDGRVVIGVTGSGGAHSWVMAWSDSIPDGTQGWVVVESTSGKVKPGACLQYEGYAESVDGEDMCFIKGSEVLMCNEFCKGCIYG